MKTITNKFKLALAVLGLFAIGTVSAQTTSGNISKQTESAPGSDGTGSIRLIDNKGTIKYLQAANGITMLTNDNTGDVTTTTWQLGGTLTNNTYITASATGGPGSTPAEFALDGLELVTDVTTASTDATSRSIHGTGTGFTVLIRNEATGAVQKIRLSDLLEVQGSQQVFTGTQAAPGAGEIQIGTAADITGSPAGLIYQKVSVYRNGAKLVANLDYQIANNGAGTLSQLTLIDRSAATSPADWTLYAGDVIEIHWIK